MTLSPLTKGLALALVHVAIVGVLGAKLLIDRERYPRVWVATAPVDPDLPIRGRYVQLRMLLPVLDWEPTTLPDGRMRSSIPVTVELLDGALVARAGQGYSSTFAWFPNEDDRTHVVVYEPLAFFIPEDVDDPSIRPEGEMLWVEITVPPTGPPRPIQLGVNRNDGPVEPLSLR